MINHNDKLRAEFSTVKNDLDETKNNIIEYLENVYNVNVTGFYIPDKSEQENYKREYDFSPDNYVIKIHYDKRLNIDSLLDMIDDNYYIDDIIQYEPNINQDYYSKFIIYIE